MAARRPRPWLRLITVLGVIGLLLGAAELALRLIIPGVIATAVRDSFDLSDDHPVEVGLEGSAVLHALTGRVGGVNVEVLDVPVLEGVAVTVHASAASVPFDVSKGRIDGATASVTIPRDQLDPLISLATSGLAQSAEVRHGNLQIGRKIDFFGVGIPLEVTLAISVADGNVVVDPVTIGAAGAELTAAEISRLSLGSLRGILTEQSICVRDRMPVGVTLTSIEFSSTGDARISADLSPEMLSNPAELEYGSCK